LGWFKDAPVSNTLWYFLTVHFDFLAGCQMNTRYQSDALGLKTGYFHRFFNESVRNKRVISLPVSGAESLNVEYLPVQD
jgi:hypothetical protein